MADWPHGPLHRLDEAGTYIVTSGTYRKEHLFAARDRLDLLQAHLLELAAQHGWLLQAWAIFPNHYHVVAISPENAGSLRRFVQHLHSVTARAVNAMDGTPGRKVWHQYWDSRITFQTSYLARLNYVHQNAQRHGVVLQATAYPWCSAGWFEQCADRAFYKVVTEMKIDMVNVRDDYDVKGIE